MRRILMLLAVAAMMMASALPVAIAGTSYHSTPNTIFFSSGGTGCGTCEPSGGGGGRYAFSCDTTSCTSTSVGGHGSTQSYGRGGGYCQVSTGTEPTEHGSRPLC
jgi:hypothetical protein